MLIERFASADNLKRKLVPSGARCMAEIAVVPFATRNRR
jgi:hypothetical protein